MLTDKNDTDDFADVRDGLTRKQRIILNCLNKLQHEKGGCNVPTCMLYGRVLEYIDIGVDEMQTILQAITANNENRR